MPRYHWLIAMFALLCGVYLTTIACGGGADETLLHRSQPVASPHQAGDGESNLKPMEGEYQP